MVMIFMSCMVQPKQYNSTHIDTAISYKAYNGMQTIEDIASYLHSYLQMCIQLTTIDNFAIL